MVLHLLQKQLGVQDVSHSPTFSLVNEYLSQKGETIYHFDFYRIEKEEEAYDIGIEEYFYGNNWCLIEWPEKVENLITKALNKAMPNGTLLSKSYKILATDKPLVTTFKLEMDEEDWDEEKEEFQMSLDGELLPNGFVKAGFTDINIDFDDDYTKFDFYDTESICKLPVIYTIAQTRPEAGAFAPCSLYMYKIKGKNEMQIGFPTVYNWISLLNITRKDDMKLLEDTQTRMIDILTSLTSE